MSSLSRFLRERRHAMVEWNHLYGARFSTKTGVGRGQGRVPIVVTLTTIPERLAKMPVAIESLLRQNLKPDRLILWLDEKLEGKLPLLLHKQMERGLEVRFVRDIGPYTKVIYALKEFADCRVVSCDDDMIYPRDWLKELVEAHELHPQLVICQRARRMVAGPDGLLRPYEEWKICAADCETPSFSIFPVCTGGILYPPGSLHPEVFNEAVFRKICPIADDVWMKAMSLLNNVRCHKVAPVFVRYPCVRGTQHKNLASENMLRGRNDSQIRAVFEHCNLRHLLATVDFTLLQPSPVV
jgi:hypothetical protein